MINNRKKILALGLSTMIAMSTYTAFGQGTSFKDVPKGHWAQSYIQKVSSQGLFIGYDGNIFKPQENISRIQAVILSSRLIDVTEAEKKKLKSEHEVLLTNANIPQWAKEAVAIALENDIISTSEVYSLISSGGEQVQTLRTEICKYLTRALGLEKEAKNTTSFNLPFNDAEDIKKEDMPYIDMMVRKDIIAGDEKGNFNPDNKLTRAEMAKVLAIASEYKQTKKPEVEITTKVEGRIYNINNVGQNIYLSIRDLDSVLRGYTIDSKTKLYMDGETTKLEEFTNNMRVTLEVTDSNIVVSMQAKSITEDYEGTVYDVRVSSPSTMTVEYKVNKNDSRTERVSFPVHDDANIIVNGNKGSLRDIKNGDKIDIRVVNSRITEIDVDSKNKEIEGILRSIEYKRDDTVLIIRGDDKENYEYPLHEKVTVRRNRRNRSIDDLRRGDKIEVKIEDDKIIEVHAESVDKEDRGTITAMKSVEGGMEITISSSDSKENTYYVPRGTRVLLDKERKDILDIRMGHFVELEIEGEEVVVIEAKSVNTSEQLTGTIEHINSRAEILTLTVIEGNNKKEIQVSLIDSNIQDARGEALRFSSLEEGDTVLVIGNYDGRILNATLVTSLSHTK